MPVLRGYGKEVLRGRSKVYLADAALAPSVLLKGKSLLEDADGLARAVETAFFKHVVTRYYSQAVSFSYWRGTKDREVDIIANLEGRAVPFEVKYRGPGHTGMADLKGMVEFCAAQQVELGYVITRELADFKVQAVPGANTRLLNIPAALACYWLGKTELAAQTA